MDQEIFQWSQGGTEYKRCTVWITTFIYYLTLLNCRGFMVMFCTFLSLPDHFTAIKQPEGIKKELTQSSLVCAKGKASSFFHSLIHSFIHSFQGVKWNCFTVLQILSYKTRHPSRGGKRFSGSGCQAKIQDFQIPLTHWASVCGIFFTRLETVAVTVVMLMK